jgi:hypothetical protein
MHALRTNLRGLVARHVEQADDRELLDIFTALYGKPEQEVPAPAPASARGAGAPRIDAPRFEIVADAIARDTSTGLEWTRKNVTPKAGPWAVAAKACEQLELAGGGWRLPTIRELLSLVDYERHDPAINTDVFTCDPNWYWTSTAAAPSPGDYAWFVYFGDGYAGWSSRGNDGFVRAVRAGQ